MADTFEFLQSRAKARLHFGQLSPRSLALPWNEEVESLREKEKSGLPSPASNTPSLQYSIAPPLHSANTRKLPTENYQMNIRFLSITLLSLKAALLFTVCPPV